MDEILSSEWTITIIGGTVSTILGTVVTTFLMRKRVQRTSSSMRPPSLNSFVEYYGCLEIVGLWSMVAGFEVVWTGFVVKVVLPLFVEGLWGGFGMLAAFFFWVGGVASIPTLFFGERK
jgi:hypothetical protein